MHYQKLPIDTLKIDKSFIDDIKTGNEPKHLLGDMISMAHHLNLSVIAEGVETNEQLKYLRNHGCDYAQGYLLGKPMELKTLKALIGSRATGQR